MCGSLFEKKEIFLPEAYMSTKGLAHLANIRVNHPLLSSGFFQGKQLSHQSVCGNKLLSGKLRLIRSATSEGGVLFFNPAGRLLTRQPLLMRPAKLLHETFPMVKLARSQLPSSFTASHEALWIAKWLRFYPFNQSFLHMRLPWPSRTGFTNKFSS